MYIRASAEQETIQRIGQLTGLFFIQCERENQRYSSIFSYSIDIEMSHF